MPNEKLNLSPNDYKIIHEKFMSQIKRIYELATQTNEYKFDGMIRYSGELDFIIYESLKIQNASKLPAHFLHGIATRHPFMDGNKRTALLMGLLLTYSTIKDPSFKKRIMDKISAILESFKGSSIDDKIVKFMLETADKKHSLEEIKIFLEDLILR